MIVLILVAGCVDALLWSPLSLSSLAVVVASMVLVLITGGGLDDCPRCSLVWMHRHNHHCHCCHWWWWVPWSSSSSRVVASKIVLIPIARWHGCTTVVTIVVFPLLFSSLMVVVGSVVLVLILALVAGSGVLGHCHHHCQGLCWWLPP